MTVISITITSDPVCPWCYIGYRRLTKAINLYQKTYPGGSQDEVHITWRPYFLDRDAPMESIPYIDRMTQKLGADKVLASQAHLQRLGKPDGIQFRFGGRIGNTMRAHQVILLCERYDAERGRTAYTDALTTAVVEGLFRVHFEEEGDLTDVGTLARIVEDASAGSLDAGRVRGWLEGGEAVEEIERMAERARREEGVKGGGVTLSGAQDVGEFLEALIAFKDKEGGHRSGGDEGCR
ncbi:thioredoxin-like protein [Aspergillus egyptiacus]|nr:thioredoxin-like protein [Aspergillus egyptiacus]